MRRLSLEWLAVLAASALVCAVLVLTAATSRIDNVFYDNLLRLGHRPASADIVIVTIDEQSLAEVGAWPWPRSVHARILDRLTAAGVRAIAYDVLFVEPGDPGQDGELVEAAANAGNLCLPVAFDVPGANGAAYDARPPFQPLATVAGLGHVDTPYDADGVARRAILAQGDGRRTLPHLMECARLSRPQAVDRTGQIPVSVDGQALVREAPVLIPFTQPGSYRTVPAVSVLRGEVPAAFLKDKYVLVGATAAGLNDRHATPVTRRGGAMPGIELEANLLDGRINGQIARQAGPLTTLVASEVGVLLLMLTLALATPRRALPLGFGLMLLAVAASALALIHGRIWMGPFPFIITTLAAFPLWGWRRLEAASHYMLEELQRFSAEPDLLTLRAFHAEEGDTVARQIQLMNQTIQRVRDLRQFTSDTLKSLPDPTLVVGLQGAVLFANP